MPEDIKVCVKCKHYNKNMPTPYMLEHRCGKFTVPDPVTGVGYIGFIKCGEARGSTGHCTYEGIHWESNEVWEE